MSRAYKRWQPAEDATLASMYPSATVAALARKFCCTQKAIKSRVYALGLLKSGQTTKPRRPSLQACEIRRVHSGTIIVSGNITTHRMQE